MQIRNGGSKIQLLKIDQAQTTDKRFGVECEYENLKHTVPIYAGVLSLTYLEATN